MSSHTVLSKPEGYWVVLFSKYLKVMDSAAIFSRISHVSVLVDFHKRPENVFYRRAASGL